MKAVTKISYSANCFYFKLRLGFLRYMLSLCIIERKCLLKVVTKKVKQSLWIQIFNTNPFTDGFSPEFETDVFSKHRTTCYMSCITDFYTDIFKSLIFFSNNSFLWFALNDLKTLMHLFAGYELLFPVTSFFTIQCKISLADMVCFITIFAWFHK